MELKEFVKNVLVDLNQALEEVKGETWYTYDFWEKWEKHINFEINIAVEEWKTLEAGAKLKVLWMWLWTDWKSSDKINNSHKISFSLTEKWKFEKMIWMTWFETAKFQERKDIQKRTW